MTIRDGWAVAPSLTTPASRISAGERIGDWIRVESLFDDASGADFRRPNITN